MEGLRTMILAGGTGQPAVGDLRVGDLADLAWSGNPAHLRSVAAALQRAAQGLEDYLVVRAPGGQPVAKMRVDYTSEANIGVFSQLATVGPLQGAGCHRPGRAWPRRAPRRWRPGRGWWFLRSSAGAPSPAGPGPDAGPHPASGPIRLLR
jgi:hypothetical protein